MFLHVIPANDMAKTPYGTFKDVITRVQWLQERFPDYRQIAVQKDDPAVVDAAVSPGQTPTGALVEYSYYPCVTRRIRERWPTVPLAVRCINLEPLQHFDNHGWWPSRGPFWMLYGMARLAWMDLQTRRVADMLLCINDWEISRYWKWLPGRAKVLWLPYLCPNHLIPRDPLPYTERKVIACLPTSQKNRKSWDLVTRFLDFARASKRKGLEAEFVVTGDIASWGLPACPEVSFTGMIDDLARFLGTCRAVCLLSPLGYGFKTTMGDALSAGAHVIAHPRLIRRSPASLRSLLLASERPDLQQALDQQPVGAEWTIRVTRQFNATMLQLWPGAEQVYGGLDNE